MRREEKEITDRGLIDSIIRKCQVCRLGLSKDNMPYIVPVSFGYDGTNIYFHTAKEGKKIDFIETNPNACFEFEKDVAILPDVTTACHWTFSFQSVIGFGTISEIKDEEGKIQALNHIMRQYSSKNWSYPQKMLGRVRTWKLSIETISGKQSKDKEAT